MFITSSNYINVYCAWCNKNGCAPISQDIFNEIFLGCNLTTDYEKHLNFLFEIHNERKFTQYFMLKLVPDTINTLTIRLKLRLELFKRIPSGTNMLLAYSLIDELILKTYSESKMDISNEVTKNVERFDKLKNLALSTKFIAERRLAFERSLEIFKKLTQIEI